MSDRSAMVGMVLVCTVIALLVSGVTAVVAAAAFYDDASPCHDCEGCNP